VNADTISTQKKTDGGIGEEEGGVKGAWRGSEKGTLQRETLKDSPSEGTTGKRTPFPPIELEQKKNRKVKKERDRRGKELNSRGSGDFRGSE